MLSLPTAIGPYSQAVKANGFIFVSGQIPATPQENLIEGTVTDKTRKLCQNAEAVLGAAGSSLAKVVKVQVCLRPNKSWHQLIMVKVYFQNFDDVPEFYEIYSHYFPHRPARTSLQTSRLPAGASLMLDVFALQ